MDFNPPTVLLPGQVPAFNAIKQFYGDRCAERSKVPLINHIIEGQRVLILLDADRLTRDAFCLHPLVQDDVQLIKHLAYLNCFDPRAVALAMEYRAVANAWLSDKVYDDDGPVFDYLPKLSALTQVNQMLVADKVQNYADFLLYHKDKHERSEQLDLYFQTWLAVLNISEGHYQALSTQMKAGKF